MEQKDTAEQRLCFDLRNMLQFRCSTRLQTYQERQALIISELKLSS